MTQTGMVAGGRLTDWISLGVLASAVPRDAVDDAVEAAGRGAKISLRWSASTFEPIPMGPPG